MINSGTEWRQVPLSCGRPERSACPCRGTLNSDALTEARAQRNNESFTNAATVFTTQESLDALKLVIEKLLQFYKTSGEATVKMIQYAPDSTYKADQKEWTGIEGMIQSDFERTIQETPAAEKAAQEAFILTERTETSALRFVLSVRQHRDLRLQPMG